MASILFRRDLWHHPTNGGLADAQNLRQLRLRVALLKHLRQLELPHHLQLFENLLSLIFRHVGSVLLAERRSAILAISLAKPLGNMRLNVASLTPNAAATCFCWHP